MESKVIVVGPSNYSDYQELESFCSDFIKHLQIDGISDVGEIEIVNGAFDDFSSLVRRFAQEHRLRIRGFIIGWVSMNFVWSNHTEDMIKYAASCKHSDLIAFWDGKDAVTKEVLKLAEEYKINKYISLVGGRSYVVDCLNLVVDFAYLLPCTSCGEKMFSFPCAGGRASLNHRRGR